MREQTLFKVLTRSCLREDLTPEDAKYRQNCKSLVTDGTGIPPGRGGGMSFHTKMTQLKLQALFFQSRT